jgi:3-hydroxymyristoyl/3-hydroxydecanoyl-(acyl carrier protein) dehydratase
LVSASHAREDFPGAPAKIPQPRAKIPMSGHFAAFSFVDRLTHLEPGKRAAGCFLVPAHLSGFSSCLALEAAGQLAAWVAMAKLDFKVRPVAGVATNVQFGAPVRPGQTLDLQTTIDTCDQEAVQYSASASVSGVKVIELEHSLGPMLPLEDFDAVEAMRSRFELLCGPGAPAGQFSGVPEHDIEVAEDVAGQSSRALLRVPQSALFFSDHFPRRPVFPGTMLLDAHIQTSLAAAARLRSWPPGVRLGVVRVPNMKLRAFISPGDSVELLVDLAPEADESVVMVKTGARLNGKQIAMGQLEIAVLRSEA